MLIPCLYLPDHQIIITIANAAHAKNKYHLIQ